MAVRFTEDEFRALTGEKPASTGRHAKYKNTKCELDGISFDSERERDRYAELKILERSGKITDLTLQPSFIVVPAVKENGKVIQRAVKYIADFSYKQDGNLIVEDSKGVRTQAFIIKRKLMLAVHGIHVREV